MDNSLIQTFLTRYGWSYEKTESGSLATSFVSANADIGFLIVITVDPPWLRFTIPVYMALPLMDNRAVVAERLLKLNARTRLVRFALHETDQIILCSDLPCMPELAYEQFEVALDTLCYIAETSYPFVAGIIATPLEQSDVGR